MARTGTADVNAELSGLVERVQRGEEIVIARDGEPVAKIVGLDRPKVDRRAFLGSLKGRIWVADDFDAPLPDAVQRAFEGVEDEHNG